MGRYEKQMWFSTGAGQSRKQRASGAYWSYMPTMLVDRDLSLDADVVNDVSLAQTSIVLLNETGHLETNTEGLARLLMRAEAVSSSHIEGLTVGARRLLRAEMALTGQDGFKADAGAVAIVGNIKAMEEALDSALAEPAVTIETVLNIHRTLCAGTPIQEYGGKIRTAQNWVGGSSYNPLNAEFVPPAPEHVEDLLHDLALFCNRTDISPIEQAAVAHAQFETIHPFADGNGRTGRVLIHLILKRRGIASRFVPPISLALATHSADYLDGLVGFRYDDEKSGDGGRRGLNDWVSTFAGCCIIACEEAERFETATERIKKSWEELIGSSRKGSIASEAMDAIVAMPIFTVSSLAKHCNRSFAAVNAVVASLVEVGCIKTVSEGKRNRVFEATDIINEFNMLELKLASPAGDTRAEPPARPVPENLGKALRKRRER